jgi:hypothetical protein
MSVRMTGAKAIMTVGGKQIEMPGDVTISFDPARTPMDEHASHHGIERMPFETDDELRRRILGVRKTLGAQTEPISPQDPELAEEFLNELKKL